MFGRTVQACISQRSATRGPCLSPLPPPVSGQLMGPLQSAVRPQLSSNRTLRACRGCPAPRNAKCPCRHRPAAAVHLPLAGLIDCSSSEEGNIAETVIFYCAPACGRGKGSSQAAYSPPRLRPASRTWRSTAHCVLSRRCSDPSADLPCRRRRQAHQPTHATSRGLLSSHGCTNTGRLQKANRWQKQGGH